MRVTIDDDRISGRRSAQNGRMAECLNAAAKEKLPILFLVIDNGRAINTFTPDVAMNNNVFAMGKHYSVPGCVVDGQNMEDTLRTGRAVTTMCVKMALLSCKYIHFGSLTLPC